MDEVAAMLRENDIEPMMAEATARRLHWCAEQGRGRILDRKDQNIFAKSSPF
jgi:hypothetical protein